jgi:hypothetical protein
LALLGGKCNWPGCDWTDERALQIDHIHGGGRAEYQRSLNGAMYLRKVLRTENPHLKYQLLCANHNWVKRAINDENGTAARDSARQSNNLGE